MTQDAPTTNINVMTAEGQKMLAELAKDKPVFTVLHGCDDRDQPTKN